MFFHKNIAYFLSALCAAACITRWRSSALAPPHPTVAPLANDTLPKVNKTKYLYFTVDDGPSQYSDDILSVAEEMGVPMTTFLVGQHLWGNEYPKFVDAYRGSACIEMGNHSYSHANNDYDRWYLQPQQVLLDFQKNDSLYGLTNHLARLPGRSVWKQAQQQKCDVPNGCESGQLLHKNNYQVFGWDVEWNYWHKTGKPKESVAQMLAKIQKCMRLQENMTPDHVVLLLHERHFQDKATVVQLIRALRETGFEFALLKDYPKG